MYMHLAPQGTAKLNFPGFQEILDFTATGSEASKSVTVDGDTDKEYIVYVRNLGVNEINITLNGATTDYGRQYIVNNAGSVTAARNTTAWIAYVHGIGEVIGTLSTPKGLQKLWTSSHNAYTSGTTVGVSMLFHMTYNSTANVTSIDFASSAGNMASGSRITVYARRSNV